jgi:hypothetical protein
MTSRSISASRLSKWCCSALGLWRARAPLRGGRRHVLGSRGQKNNSRLFLFVAGVQPLPECGMARCNASIVLRYSFFPGLSIGINYKK